MEFCMESFVSSDMPVLVSMIVISDFVRMQ